MSNSNVQEVRDRIIQLAREIEELSKSTMPPKSFFQEFLKRVIAAVGARAGVVWLRGGANRLEMLAEQGLAQTTFAQNPNAMQANQKILIDVISNGQACTYHPSETTEELPTEDMLVLAALQQNKEVVGVVEIFQRRETPAQARPGFLQFVEQMTGYACRFLDRQTAPQADSQISVPKVAEEFEQFILQLHRSLDLREVAVTAANDGRLLVGCDRLSVAILDGRKAVIRAISGQESVNQRANLVRKMTAVADKVISSGEKMLYTGKVDHLAPQVETALADFIQESGSRMVSIIPFFEPDPVIEKDDDNHRGKEKNRKPIGGLIVEQVAESQPKTGVMEKADLIADHVGSSVFNAKQYNRIFLMPLWRGIGRCLRFLEGRNGLKAALGVVAAILLVVAMVFIPWEYKVEGTGRLMPVVQKDVFAPWDGEVVEVKCTSGQRVQAGDVLLIIDNPDLRQQWTAARGELGSKEVTANALATEHGQLSGSDKAVQQLEIAGKWQQTIEEISSLKAQLQILEDRISQLTVKAPIGGVVATFQIEQLLLNRPVRRGELLIEIKDDTGVWQLELEVEDRRMGHFDDAQKAAGTSSLPVEFALVTNPETHFNGKIIREDNRTNASEEQGGVVLVHVDFDKEQLRDRVPRIGAEVRAKILCGQKSLGYVLFGDVVEFVQKYFWL